MPIYNNTIIAQYPLNLSQYGPYLEISFGDAPSPEKLGNGSLEDLKKASDDAAKDPKKSDTKVDKITSHIFGLYIPEDFTSNLNINWESTQILGLAGAASKIINMAKTGVTEDSLKGLGESLVSVGTQAYFPTMLEKITGTSEIAKKAWNEAEYTFGFAFNPRERLKFDSADYFQLDLSWEMIPHSEKEAEHVETIVSSLQNLCLPGFKGSEDWLSAPQVATIRFIQGGDGEDHEPIAAISDNDNTKQENLAASYLLRFATKMALTNVTVKLITENSSSFYSNGRAIGYNISCTFKSIFKAIRGNKENKSINKESISELYQG